MLVYALQWARGECSHTIIQVLRTRILSSKTKGQSTLQYLSSRCVLFLRLFRVRGDKVRGAGPRENGSGAKETNTN